MSTILKALRRLEEDEPRDAAAGANAGASSPAPASSGDAGEASEGTDGLRDRILAEERANQRAQEAATGRPASPEAPDAGIESSTSALRRFASLAAVALVVFVLGAVVVPALFDSPEPTSDVASAGPGEASDARVAATDPAAASPPPRSPAPSTPPRASATAPPAPGASRASATAPREPAPPRAEVDLAKARAETLARRANPPEAMRPAPTDSVAVADLPVAPPSRPTAKRESEPPVELALVEPTRNPPPAEAPAATSRATTAATREAPAPRTATSSPPRPRPRREPPPPRSAEPSASSDRPVAKTADADPIERVTRPDVPDVTVLRTAWHPDPSRRSARVRLEASEEVLTLEEGDAIGALVLKEISPSAVLFEAGDVEVRRRVGSGG